MHIHLDLIGGLAGDMFLAAAIDAELVDLEALEEALATLGLGVNIRIDTEHGRRGAIAGTHVRFAGWDADKESDHRHLTTIQAMIDGADLPAGVAERALEMFRTLGEAEAEIHGIPLEKVHFHEVGAVDSILDFVAAAWVIESVDATWSVGKIPAGRGTIVTAHGEIPVPAPATAKLLTGFELDQRNVDAELVTPTGATILRTIRPGYEQRKGRLRGTGFGLGTRDVEGTSNVVRMMVFDEEATSALEHDRVVRVETEIDDLDPETLATVAERLLPAAGALDVVRTAVQMKKGRQGTRITVLAPPQARDAIVDCLLRETSTFGVRVDEVERLKLRRKIQPVSTEFGEVRVKVGWSGRETVRYAPEHDDCVQRAAEHGVPVQRVRRAALRAIEALGRED